MLGIKPITVVKRNLQGKETWRYTGRLLKHEGNVLSVEAFFDRRDMPFQGIVLKRGDRFVETYYTTRWYNVFEIYDRDNGSQKGWYCNICYPAVLESKDVISYVDLALDLWVTPDGHQVVLDEVEFAALNLDTKAQREARTALAELQAAFAKTNKPPK